MKKKTKKVKKAVKKTAPKKSQEIVLRVLQPDTIPTTQELSEPMRDGKKMTIPKTWLNDAQLVRMVQSTPKEHKYSRPGKGGKVWTYVTGAYVEKVLNFVFAWNWDFDIVEHGVEGEFIWVKGRLTVRGTKPGEQIIKTQFGRKEIAYLKDKAHKPENYLDFGNDLKSASTDALKKCASLLGIASDIYGKQEYKSETNRDPKEPQDIVKNPVTHPKQAPTTEVIYPCVGADGKGCKYGVPEISEQEKNYSNKMFGKSLCRECQKDAKAKK